MVILADISVAPTNFPLKRLYRAAQTPFQETNDNRKGDDNISAIAVAWCGKEQMRA